MKINDFVIIDEITSWRVNGVMLKLFQKDQLLIRTSYFCYLLTTVSFFLFQRLRVRYVRVMLVIELFEKHKLFIVKVYQLFRVGYLFRKLLKVDFSKSKNR
jgi:hypothetical protein